MAKIPLLWQIERSGKVRKIGRRSAAERRLLWRSWCWLRVLRTNTHLPPPVMIESTPETAGPAVARRVRPPSHHRHVADPRRGSRQQGRQTKEAESRLRCSITGSGRRISRAQTRGARHAAIDRSRFSCGVQSGSRDNPSGRGGRLRNSSYVANAAAIRHACESAGTEPATCACLIGHVSCRARF